MPSSKSKLTRKPKAEAPIAAVEWSFEAIGTQWWIGLYQPLGEEQFRVLKAAVAERIEAFDKAYSRFRPDSLVTQISQRADSYQLPDDAAPLFALYRQLYEATDGAVTPLIGQTLSDAGYDAGYSLQPQATIEPAPVWDDVMRLQTEVLTTKQPLLLDFGAAGKGYLVDIVAEMIAAHGITQFSIDAGGDMVHRHGSQSLRIGLEHPVDLGQVIGVVELRNQAVCGSAGNRRAWPGYHHIMNPFTASSTQSVQAVWVVTDDALTADGLTTALFFVEPERLATQFKFEYVIVAADNSVRMSHNFPGTLFTV